MFGVCTWFLWLILFLDLFFGFVVERSFSVTPYIRLANLTVAISTLSIWWWVRVKHMSLRVPVTRGLATMLALAGLWLVIGLGFNPLTPYIATDFFFYSSGLLFFMIGRDLTLQAARAPANDGDISKLPVRFTWLVILLALTFFILPSIRISPFLLLLPLCALAGDFYLKRVRWVTVGAIYLVIALYAWQGNRSFLAAVGVATIGLFVLAAGRTSSSRLFRLLIILGAMLFGGVLLFGLIPNLQGDSALLGRLRETYTAADILLAGGDLTDVPIAIYQRIYEATLITDKIIHHPSSWITTVFGQGFGALLDMGHSDDESVTGSAALGSSMVHNIHFLPYMILYRFGLVGVAVAMYFSYVLLGKSWFFLSQNRSRAVPLEVRRISAFQLASLIYACGWLMYSTFASATLIDSPFLFISLGVVSTIGHTLFRSDQQWIIATSVAQQSVLSTGDRSRA
ncbi:MAG: hypothetical protein ACSLE5_16305 [Porticoccaceae bacterium]